MRRRTSHRLAPTRHLFSFLMALVCLTQLSFGQASVNELFQTAKMKMSKGAFMDAIPDITQLIEYLGESKDPRVKAQMQAVFFSLGIAHFFLGEFDKSGTAFTDYKKRYPHGAKIALADLYAADCQRFTGKLKPAIKAYEAALHKHLYGPTLKCDMYSAIARCHLADGNWHDAIPALLQVLQRSTDFVQYNWAATLLTTAYFKDLELDKIYPLVPLLLKPNSFASRSIAFNMAALEAGDALFGEERYRDALWVHRMVYPHDLVTVRSEQYLQFLKDKAERLKESGAGDARALMRLQESIGELEEELKAIEQIENYDIELYFRIARGYMELSRFWEAREIFLHLHTTCEKDQAEEALFLAFRCSSGLLPWDRAYEIGQMYMDKYPSGEWFDMVSLAVGQMYSKEQNWPLVIKSLTKALEISPKHQSAGECMFLIGYAAFMEEMFQKAAVTFQQIIQIFPESELVGPSTYWTAMALMFDGKYADAAPHFDRILNDFSQSIYVEDSAFRRAVCDYGLSKYPESDKRLEQFVQRYPKSKLIGEGIMMRGDIAGAVGEVEAAVAFYQQAMTFEGLNIEYYNHCAFQTARLLQDKKDWAGLRSHFLQYIDRNVEGSNIPQAIYWVGVSLWNTGEQEGALRYYRSAVEKYGKDPKQVGIDMILDEWISKTRRGDPELAKKAWNDLKRAYREAVSRGEKSTILRLTRVLLYDPELKASAKENMISGLLKEENFEHASPAVSQAMLDHSVARKQRAFAKKAANHIIDTYTETDYALDARMVLARFAIEEAKQTKVTIEQDALYEEAVRHLGVVRAVYAATPEAGEALITLGWLYLDQKKYKECEESFKNVLGFKTWKALWPEALYGRGQCFYEQRKYAEATAPFERIYLMYSHYKHWAAKGYLRRAECLKRLYQPEKAVEVLNEMLADPDIADLPEAKEARSLLSSLKK